MPANLASLRSQVERALAGRVAAPFECHDCTVTENVSTGIEEIDLLTGGFPRGALTEIFGCASSGRATLLVAALRARTEHNEECALIDATDAFDPCTAEAVGVNLKQLLWVRCRNVGQALRATDLILQGGGFSFVCLDLSDLSHKIARKIPLDTWFRFRRAVENTRTILMIIEQESNAKTCASLVLKLKTSIPQWSDILLDDGRQLRTKVFQEPFTRLLGGIEVHAEVLRSRMKPVTRLQICNSRLTTERTSIHPGMSKQEKTFRASSLWNRFSNTYELARG